MVLNYIWIAFFFIAFVVALAKLCIGGDTAVFTDIINASFASAKTGFEVSLGLTGILSLWLGIMGSKTLLITMDMNKIAQMSCNPAVGGIAKGQIVREIDALGGNMGIVTDSTAIQFRMLNRSKGPAMWSPRAQSDRAKFIQCWRHLLENIPNLFMPLLRLTAR